MNDQYTPLLVYRNAIGLPPLASRPVRTALLSPVGPEGYLALGPHLTTPGAYPVHLVNPIFRCLLSSVCSGVQRSFKASNLSASTAGTHSADPSTYLAGTRCISLNVYSARPQASSMTCANHAVCPCASCSATPLSNHRAQAATAPLRPALPCSCCSQPLPTWRCGQSGSLQPRCSPHSISTRGRIRGSATATCYRHK
jgi:hypothetical protein